MSEGGYKKFWPGDTIELALEIRHDVQMHLRRASAWFLHRERPDVRMDAEGAPVETQDGRSSVVLMLEVPAEPFAGVYTLARLWVETFGGRTYDYQPDELDAEFGFEIIEEADVKPEVLVSFAE
jgi:hypothetical protein